MFRCWRTPKRAYRRILPKTTEQQKKRRTHQENTQHLFNGWKCLGLSLCTCTQMKLFAVIFGIGKEKGIETELPNRYTLWWKIKSIFVCAEREWECSVEKETNAHFSFKWFVFFFGLHTIYIECFYQMYFNIFGCNQRKHASLFVSQTLRHFVVMSSIFMYTTHKCFSVKRKCSCSERKHANEIFESAKHRQGGRITIYTPTFHGCSYNEHNYGRQKNNQNHSSQSLILRPAIHFATSKKFFDEKSCFETTFARMISGTKQILNHGTTHGFQIMKFLFRMNPKQNAILDFRGNFFLL